MELAQIKNKSRPNKKKLAREALLHRDPLTCGKPTIDPFTPRATTPVYDLCQAVGMDYDTVCEGVTADSRIGKSHTKVPGIDNDRGFGGTCFPKDLNSLIVQMESHGVNADMLKEVWKYNEQIRKVIDWPVT